MRLLTQPNNWTCCATSYAMLMDISVEDVFCIAGHDGSEIIFYDLKEPDCRRGHVPYEFVEHALSAGCALTQFCVDIPIYHKLKPCFMPHYTPFGNDLLAIDNTYRMWSRPTWHKKYGLQLLRRLREKYDLLILCENRDSFHYVACSKDKIYDPVGVIINEPVNPIAFWAKISLSLLDDK